MPQAPSSWAQFSGESSGLPDRIFAARVHKPPVQRIVVQLLEQKQLGANPEARLQQPCQEEMLRRHLRQTFDDIELAKAVIKQIDSLVSVTSDAG